MAENQYGRTIKYLLISIVVLIPLIRFPYTSDQVSLPKFAFLIAASLLLCGIWLAKLILEGESNISFPSLCLPVLGFFLASALATVTSVRPITSFWGSYSRYQGMISLTCYVILFFFARNYFKSGPDRMKFLHAVTFTGILVSVIGLMQHFQVKLGALYLFFVGDKTRIESNLGNPNFLGAFLNLTIPLTLAALVIMLMDGRPADRTRQRAYYFLTASTAISIGFQLSALYYSLSRGAWVGVVAAFFLAAILFFLTTPAVRRKVSAPAVALLVLTSLLLSIVGFMVFYRHQLIFAEKPRHQASAVLSYVTGSDTSKSRFVLWLTTLRMIKDHPVLGTGPDTYELVFPKYRPSNYDRLVGFAQYPDRPHNDFLQVASTVGLLGFFFYLWIHLAAARRGISVLRRSADPKDTFFALFLVCAIAGYVVQNQFNFHTMGTAPLLWIVLGLAGSLNGTRERKILIRLPGWEKLSLEIRLVIFLVVAFMLMASAFKLTYAPLAASRNAYLASVSNIRKKLPDAIAQAQSAKDLMPIYDQYTIFLGNLFERYSLTDQRQRYYFHDQAINTYEEAIDINPLSRKAYLELGVSHLKFGEKQHDIESIKRAAEVFKQVTKLEPNYSQGHYNLAVCYYYLRDLDNGIREFKTAIRLNPKEIDAYLLLGKSYEKEGRKKKAMRSYETVLRMHPSRERKKEAREALGRLKK